MAAIARSTDDDTDLRDRQERDRLVRRARREPPRYVRDSGRLSDNVQTIDRVADRIANDVNALTRAWSASNAEVFKGVVTVVGNIALDLFGDARRYRPSAYDDGDRDRDRDRDRGSASRRRRPDAVEEVGGDLAGFTHSLSDAFAGAASVVARSSRRFQEEFDTALDESADFDSDIGRSDTDPSREPSRDRPARDAQDAVGEAGARVGAAVDDVGAAADTVAADLGDGPPGRRRPR
ncbi:hypothetical protein [uncultured Sphingomonas sp.]|uniref:hypothetical protein n=1 Tax=uncultured Sphingomonas sp. TaxID=158754 RepID=UPI0026127145|nr:hypothetical protein [uncultured Sphingomonas sp.]